jgi:hypothetical protein
MVLALPPSARIVASRILGVDARHTLRRQYCSHDPQQRDDEPEDEQDQMSVLKCPQTQKDQQKDVKDP